MICEKQSATLANLILGDKSDKEVAATSFSLLNMHVCVRGIIFHLVADTIFKFGVNNIQRTQPYMLHVNRKTVCVCVCMHSSTANIR